MTKSAVETLFVNEFTDGILDFEQEMLGPLKNGGTIVANTSPGCWGPMITPALRGGHEVTKPIFIEDAEIGDAIVIKIKSVEVTSYVTASGTDSAQSGNFVGDPFVAGKCPSCGTMHPETSMIGIGKEAAIICSNCQTEASPFKLTNGYTMAFDHDAKLGITLEKEVAEEIALDAKHYMKTPENSVQNPVVQFAPSHIVGAIARMRPFLGQLGTTPSKAMPDSHNAGDFGSFLVDAPHDFALTKEELVEHKTDGHMDINRVRAGAVLICPVKVKGGGVYVGDMHAMQGDGEIAGHTTDVSGIVQLEVSVIKSLKIDGPILLPVVDDLPFLAKPYTHEEIQRAASLVKQFGGDKIEKSYPISFVGTGENLNIATDNALQRAADLFEVPVEEIQNRCTITGAIEIGRHPGVVTATFHAPKKYLRATSLYRLVKKQYK